MNHGVKFDVKDFFYQLNEARITKVYVLLHCYEFMALFTVVMLFVKSPIILGIYIGFITHFMADILSWRSYYYSYSLFYRYSVNFDMKKIFRA